MYNSVIWATFLSDLCPILHRTGHRDNPTSTPDTRIPDTRYPDTPAADTRIPDTRIPTNKLPSYLVLGTTWYTVFFLFYFFLVYCIWLVSSKVWLFDCIICLLSIAIYYKLLLTFGYLSCFFMNHNKRKAIHAPWCAILRIYYFAQNNL